MQIKTISPDTIYYNAASNTFDALVTLNTADGTFRYPCAVAGPMTMPVQAAAFRLVQQAKKRHAGRRDLSAHTPAVVDLAKAA